MWIVAVGDTRNWESDRTEAMEDILHQLASGGNYAVIGSKYCNVVFRMHCSSRIVVGIDLTH